jgi:integrase
MPNLSAKIVIRHHLDGKRKWTAANGQSDPQGTFYIQYYSRSQTKYECLKDARDFRDAQLALIRFERRLKAKSEGFILSDETPEKVRKHRHQQCIDSYRKWQETTTKKNGRKYETKSIKERIAVLNSFVEWCPVPYIEDITRKHLTDWRDVLWQDYAQDTVLNKLGYVVSWMKRNQLVRITGLLMTEDWPERKPTSPQPFTEHEISALMAVAETMDVEKNNGGKFHLMLRVFLGTGMRIDEVAHFEAEDLQGRVIQIRRKPKWNWVPKTVTSERPILVGASLAADLREFCKRGLVFPSPKGYPYAQAIHRVLVGIGARAGVKPPSNQPKMDWAHRWRDTYATEQVRAIQKGKSELGLRDVAKTLGHSNLDTINLYAEFTRLESEEAAAAADLSDRYARKSGNVISIAS